MKKVTFIGTLLFLLLFFVTTVFAESCPKISIDPVTKKVSVIACEKKLKNNFLDGNTHTGNNNSNNNSNNNIEKNKGILSSGSFTRISQEGICPQIFVDDTTEKIKLVHCPIETENKKIEEKKDSVSGSGEADHLTGSDIPQNDKTEFEKSLSWMYKNGLTKYNNKKDYRANDPLTREEASKMFGRAYQVFGYDVNVKKNNACEFNDEKDFNLELVQHITDVCHWGLFKGAHGNFMAKKFLKKSESTAVMIRMLEGKTSYEEKNPWWTDYYQKAFLLGITTISDINSYEKIQTREEIALMFWRLKSIIESKYKDKWLSQLKKSDVNVSSGLKLTNWESDLNKVLGKVDFNQDPELIEAINWMHDNGLTKFSSLELYKPVDVLTRGQAAKIFSIFSDKLGIKEKTGLLPQSCIFSDISTLSSDIILGIQNSCKKGLMQGKTGKFSPEDPILKSQFMVVLVRMFNGEEGITTNMQPRWQGYFEKARELGLVDISDVMNFDKPIRRYEVALFMYRFHIRYNILNNINKSGIKNQLITTISKTKVLKNNKVSVDAYVDMSLFSANDLDLAYLYLFDTRYKAVKTLRREYINNSFVWYGDLFDLIDNKKLGTVNFIIRNNSLVSGVIRLGEKTYTLEQKDGVDAYFTVIEN